MKKFLDTPVGELVSEFTLGMIFGAFLGVLTVIIFAILHIITGGTIG